MNNLVEYFSNEEIDEIEVLFDGTEAMIVDGSEIICFRVLLDIIQEKNTIADVTRTELLTSYAQLKGLKETFASFGFVDTTVLESIVNKSKDLFRYELKKRQT
ncbi:hypothetical protein M3661_07705 [Paenibacillus sp. MER 180]|jgi:hypothetical protein|uniref:hypothetical protein n=1 Tax=Paenibacillus sp. MER 180 TaxID=2939570 RepID=UPI002041DBD2|nr:hypothetical protein [Paenibacillus sp. MER 180]MCM3290010.1 hypothetical protein [Paenibacillus sp. MER 180]